MKTLNEMITYFESLPAYDYSNAENKLISKEKLFENVSILHDRYFALLKELTVAEFTYKATDNDIRVKHRVTVYADKRKLGEVYFLKSDGYAIASRHEFTDSVAHPGYFSRNSLTLAEVIDIFKSI